MAVLTKIPTRDPVPSKMQGTNPAGDVVDIPVDAAGRLAIDIPLTAFGRIAVADIIPLVQLEPTLGLRTRDIEVFTSGGGAAEVESTGTGREFHCASTSTIGSYGLLRYKRIGKYRAGQGLLLAFTARFGTPVAGSAMRIGGVLSGVELSVGYYHDYGVTNGDLNPGILWRQGGELETQRLTVTAGSAGGGENITITLNGSATVVAVSGSLSTTGVAQELAAASYTGWNAYQNGATVTFIATTLGVNSNPFSFGTDGSAAGSFAQLNAGTAATDSWITQSSWNIDPVDGTGPSGMTWDPTKGNVFLIDLQYLGYGAINFYIENPASGKFTPIHQIQAANSRETPTLSQPSLKIGLFAASLGTTTPVECWSGSMEIALEGRASQFRLPFGEDNAVTGVGTSFEPILSIRGRPEMNGYINLSEIIPLRVSCAVDGTKPAEVEVVLNPTLTGADWTYEDQTNSVIEYDVSASAMTGGETLTGDALAKTGSTVINLKELGIFMGREDILTIGVKASSGTTDTTVFLTWEED